MEKMVETGSRRRNVLLNIRLGDQEQRLNGVKDRVQDNAGQQIF
jgi:hypothetical protein